MICGWWSKNDKIMQKEAGRQYIPRWPDLEKELYETFLARGNENKTVTVGWFRREARVIFKRQYPTMDKLFVFSAG